MDNIYKCKSCDKIFSRYYNYLRHLARKNLCKKNDILNNSNKMKEYENRIEELEKKNSNA